MFHINLFYEHLEAEAAKARDPLRWTLVVGSLIIAVILFWTTCAYWSFQKSRYTQIQAKKTRDQLTHEVTALKLSDAGKLSRIEKDIKILEKRMYEHPRIATILDFLISVTPPNIQISQFRFYHKVLEEKGSKPTASKNPSPQAVLIYRPILDLDMLSQATTPVAALTQRDALADFFQTNQTWSLLAGFSKNENGEPLKAEVELIVTQTADSLPNPKDSSSNKKSQASFTLKLPMKGKLLE